MVAVLVVAGTLIVPSNLRAGQAASQTHDAPAGEPDGPLGRWLDVSTATLSARYRLVRDGTDRTGVTQLQTQQVGRLRLKLDEAAKYRVSIGLQSGNTFTGSWNNTGIGTGESRTAVFLKHLYGSAEPFTGVEAQYGGIGIVRGENTEITGYDNDGYLTGGRVSLRRRRDLFFDEISVTLAFLGDLTTPNVFRRLRHLDRINYHQLLVARRIGSRLFVSTDYTDAPDADAVRQAVRVVVGARWVDAVRIEYGVRLDGPSRDTAVAATAEKHVGHDVLLTAGWSDVKPGLALLNADRYGPGQRVFTGGSVPLVWDLTASWALLRELNAPVTSMNKVRVDAVVTWNLLRTLQHAGVVH
jgi:hypothetical protein